MASKTAKIALATNVMENHFGNKWFRLSKEQVAAHCSNLGKVEQSEVEAAIKIIDDFRNGDIEKRHRQEHRQQKHHKSKIGRYEKTDIMIEKCLKAAIADKMTHSEMMETIQCDDGTYRKHVKNNEYLRRLDKCLSRSKRFIEVVVRQENGQLVFYPNVVEASHDMNVSSYTIQKALRVGDGYGVIDGNRIKLKSLWEKEGFWMDNEGEKH